MSNFTYFGPVQADPGFGSYVVLTTGPYPITGSVKFFSRTGPMIASYSNFELYSHTRRELLAPEGATNAEITSTGPMHVACYEFEKNPGGKVDPISVFNFYEIYLFPPHLNED